MRRDDLLIKLDANSPTSFYKQWIFPDGAMHVRLKEEKLDEIRNAGRVIVQADVYNAAHIVELALLKSALTTFRCAYQLHLALPFLPHGRADRRFVEGDCYGLFALLTLLGTWGKIHTLDAHSFHSRIFSTPAEPLILEAIQRFYVAAGNPPAMNILFPDEGARARYTLSDGQMVGCNTAATTIKILHAFKKRDPATGALSRFEIPSDEEMGNRPTLIVDDICDGGGTFVGIAKELRDDSRIQHLLGLYVTHGIFSKGYSELHKYFDQVYTTNTRNDMPVTVQDDHWLVKLDGVKLLLDSI